jgi:V/A-type H+-transporting ATPase subunit E
MPDTRENTSGVEQLVERLRQDGVDEGRKRAEELLESARREAAEIIESAEREAAEMREQTDRSCSEVRAAAEQALQLAVRDALLGLRTEIEDRFAAQLERMVSGKLEDREFLEKLLLSVAGRAVPREGPVEVVLPDAVPLPGEDGDNDQTESMDCFVRGLAGDMLRGGVTVATSDDLESGLLFRLGDGGLELQLDEESLTEVLGSFLLPRFRALLDGAGFEAGQCDGDE